MRTLITLVTLYLLLMAPGYTNPASSGNLSPEDVRLLEEIRAERRAIDHERAWINTFLKAHKAGKSNAAAEAEANRVHGDPDAHCEGPEGWH